MAQAYKVTKAFKSKNRDTGEVDVVPTGGGDMNKWLFQVEGQGKQGWMQVLKKPGFDLNPGDEVYGIIDEWPDGKAKFVKQDRPEGMRAPQQSAPAQQPQAQVDGSVNEKLDYIILLLESMGGAKTTEPQADVAPTDVDLGKPLDLSDIPY